jgi:deoxycytidylate deaminase
MNPINLPNFFTLAKNVSKHSTYHIRVDAVLVLHGTPVACGFNTVKTHPKLAMRLNATIHAEVSALATCNKLNIKGATCFVYRETKNGTPALARPCDDCWRALRARGVKWVYYSTNTYPYFQVENIT